MWCETNKVNMSDIENYLLSFFGCPFSPKEISTEELVEEVKNDKTDA